MKEGRLSAYNLVVEQIKTQVDYTLYETERQLKLPMETEIFIAADEPVRLVSAVVERLTIKSQAPRCEKLWIGVDGEKGAKGRASRRAL